MKYLGSLAALALVLCGWCLLLTPSARADQAVVDPNQSSDVQSALQTLQNAGAITVDPSTGQAQLVPGVVLHPTQPGIAVGQIPHFAPHIGPHAPSAYGNDITINMPAANLDIPVDCDASQSGCPDKKSGN